MEHTRQVTFSLRLPKDHPLGRPALELWRDDSPQNPIRLDMEWAASDPAHNWYRCAFTPGEPGLYFYWFSLEEDGSPLWLKREGPSQGVLTAGEGSPWQLTVYHGDFETPGWLKGGLVYQIFPDRFARGGELDRPIPPDRKLHQSWEELPDYLPDPDGEIRNQDYFGGTLAGIAAKLPYLKSLGVSCLYLNPIFEAHSNHRYNTADYTAIDPMLGSEEDFARLCALCRQEGIGVILDGVFSHTGSDSLYFNREGRYPTVGAWQSLQSPWASWYRFTQYPQEYRCWWGIPTLPQLELDDQGPREFFLGAEGILSRWMAQGANGWRLDVADELSDSFLDGLRRRVKAQSPQGVILGEVWEDASNKISYGRRRRYLLGDQLDSVMNYPWRAAILDYIRQGDGPRFYREILTLLEHYPKPAVDLMLNSLSTHDTLRAITALAGEPFGDQDRQWQRDRHTLSPEAYGLGRTRLQLASLLQYTLPGVPCLYYGDEAGLTGYRDPFNRCTYPWGREDTQLVEWFAQLGQLRRGLAPLAQGELVPLTFTGQLCAYLRRDETGTVFVAVNRGDTPVRLPLPPQGKAAVPALVLGSFREELLGAQSGVVIQWK